MYNDYSDVYSSNIATGFLAGLGVFAVIIVLFSIAIAVFELIAMAKLFQKAGKNGWFAIVPIYNIIVLYEIIGYKWYYIFITALTWVPVVGQIAVLLFALTMNVKLAKSFGQEIGFGIGLWLVSGIFVPIVAFNKNIKYVGPAVNGDIDFNDLF